MQDFAVRAEAWRQKWEKTAVLSGILLFFALIGVVCLWKYAIFGYRGFDLAYFSQVFWNTVQGRFFEQSLHPHLSLGDHAELAIAPLSLVYAVWRDPRMLLLMQAAALAACAWPAWRIAKFRLASAGSAWLPLALVAALLLNPSLHHIGLFEFHVLAFAIFPLLMAMLAYEIGNKRAFVLWCLAALLVREDVAMVVFMFGALAWTERRSRWWQLTPALLGAGWFVAAMALVAHFAPADSYKFRIYYDWLGATPLAMLTFPFRHPLQFMAHLLTLGNLEMFLGFMMPLAFLPLLRPRRLLLALGPLAQILLAAPGGGEVVLRTHYATLFLPALLLAAIDGTAVAPQFISTRLRQLRHIDPRRITIVLLLACALYGTATMSPVPHALWRAFTDHGVYARAAEYRALAQRVPADASVAASYALLPALSSREQLVSLHYVALGVLQFAEQPYAPPESRFVALDAEDLLLYEVQFSAARWAAPYREGVLERLKAQMGLPVYAEGHLALFDREAFDTAVPFVTALPASGDDLALAASVVSAPGDAGGLRLRVRTGLGWWQPPAGAAVEYVVSDSAGRALLTRIMPVDAPLPWTSRNGGTTLQYEIALPAGANSPLRVEARVLSLDGFNTLNSVDSPGFVETGRTLLLSATTEAVW